MKENFLPNPTAESLIEVISAAKLKLHQISNDDSEIKLAPDKWSKKEEIGHLIDSAIINHQRFMHAQFQDDLVFFGYDQEEWVRVQHYNSLNWYELLNLWYSLNVHISNLINLTPDEKRFKIYENHNLNEVAWRFPETEKATLDYFMRDYILHIEHHLSQVITGYKPIL